jgi:rhodanese-related sulfurtransferase
MLRLLALAAALLSSRAATAEPIASSVDPAALSAAKQTKLGLYLKSTDAFRALEADPSIVFVDVRTTADFAFVGHPAPIDANVPLRFHTTEYRADRSGYLMQDNPDFIDEVVTLVEDHGKTRDDPVFVICRSGGRSRAAADMLAGAGFTQVYNIVDGFEGGKDKATGHRTVEGWRNAGLPWTYELPDKVAYAW